MSRKPTKDALGMSQEFNEYGKQIQGVYEARIAELEAENVKLRSALEMVEWVYDGTPHVGGEWGDCPWCRNREPHGHSSDCARQAALPQLTPGPEAEAK